MFLDHTQRRTTVGRTPLDEWSARRRVLYLTTHDTHNRQISMPPVGPAAAHLLRSWVQISPGTWIFVCCECRVLSGRGLCDELITRPEESYRLWCVVVYDLETSRIGAPYIYDISNLRVNTCELYCIFKWIKINIEEIYLKILTRFNEGCSKFAVFLNTFLHMTFVTSIYVQNTKLPLHTQEKSSVFFK